MAQVKAIDKLQLRKRDMIKLMMSSVAAEDGTDMKEEDDSDGDEDYVHVHCMFSRIMDFYLLLFIQDGNCLFDSYHIFA